MTAGSLTAAGYCKLAFKNYHMAKWLTALFALFLSLQVFGARGKAVDRFLGSCFMVKESLKQNTVTTQKAGSLSPFSIPQLSRPWVTDTHRLRASKQNRTWPKVNWCPDLFLELK